MPEKTSFSLPLKPKMKTMVDTALGIIIGPPGGALQLDRAHKRGTYDRRLDSGITRRGEHAG
jgi:hypothetical protein